MTRMHPYPLPWAVLAARGLAIAALSALLALSVLTEEPLGRVIGAVYTADMRPLPGARISLTVLEGRVGSISTVTGMDGRFVLNAVPVGVCTINASSRAHGMSSPKLYVEEGRSTPISLRLDRSLSPFTCSTPAGTLLPDEQATLDLAGYVLRGGPAEQVVSVKLYRLDMERVASTQATLNACADVFSAWSAPEKVPPVLQDLLELESEHRLQVRSADVEGHFDLRTNIGAHPPGVYIAVASYGKYAAYAAFRVTDLALIVKYDGDTAYAFTADLKTGAAVGGASVRLFKDRRLTDTGVTDATGIARLNTVPGQPVVQSADAIADCIAVAHIGDRYAVTSRYGTPDGEAATKLHVYTDRPIYRPGQEVGFKGIVRKAVSVEPTYTVPSGLPVQVRIEDPEGVVLLDQPFRTNTWGSFSGKVTLSSETPSGSCAIFANAGGGRTVSSFQVASYRKPEFVVSAKPRRNAYVAGEPVEVEVSAQYYYGAPVAGAKLKYDTRWSPLWDWEGDDEYGFDKVPQWLSAADYGTVDISETTRLDERGRAVLRLPSGVTPPADGPQGHELSVHIEVEDATGRSVEATAEARVYSGDVRLFVRSEGYLLSPGYPATFTVQATDLSGQPVNSLPVRLEFSRQRRQGDRIVGRTIGGVSGVTGDGGRARLVFTPTEPGEIKITAQARDRAGRTVRVHALAWCVGDRGGDVATEYGAVSVFLDKRRYTDGDTARILINSERVGSTALVTVEGAAVHRAMSIALRTRSTVIRLPVLKAYGPSVRVSVLCVRRKRLATSSATLSVSVPSRSLRVVVTPASTTCRPHSRADYTIRVTDHAGRPVRAEASVAVVDEAIYQLAEEDPQAILDAFYPTPFSRVLTMDSCPDQLYSGDKGEPVITARKRFLDAPFWMPHLLTDASGQARVSVPMPDNLTTWRTTAIVHSRSSQFGRGTATVVATLPFHVRVDLPRYLTEGDTARLTASVANATDVPRVARVRLTCSGLKFGDQAVHEVRISPRSSAETSWMVEASAAGKSSVRADAWVADGSRLQDAVELPIEVRPRAIEVRTVFTDQMSSGKVCEHSFDGGEVRWPASITVRVTPSPMAALAPALEYLRTFPYGCTEQTVSAFLPSLRVARLLDRLPTEAARELQRALGDDFRETTAQHVRDGITRLRRLQNPNGGWGWFEHEQEEPWLTAYALLSLVEARSQGYRLPAGMLEQARDATARLFNRADRDTQAFCALALAEVGVNALHRVRPVRAAGHACAALAALRLRLPVGRSDPYINWLVAGESRQGSAWWGRRTVFDYAWSDAMGTALGIQAVNARYPSHEALGRAIRYLMLGRSDGDWYNTRDTAFIVMGLCSYIERHPKDAGRPTAVRCLLNGREIATLRPMGGRSAVQELVARVPRAAMRSGVNRIAIEPLGPGAPYYSIAVSRYSSQNIGQNYNLPENTYISRTYEVLEERTLPLRGAVRYFVPIRGSVPAGSIIRCRLKIHAQPGFSYAIITDPIPAGAEPSARGDVDAEWSEWYSATDVHDDRVVFFARRLPPGNHVIEYYLRAQTPGTFTALPARMEPMYEDRLAARTGTTVLTVR
jgi:uncharacterized protein YfaS (alpha-2-macroglobulin family)